jgi:hypothetical protein
MHSTVVFSARKRRRKKATCRAPKKKRRRVKSHRSAVSNPVATETRRKRKRKPTCKPRKRRKKKTKKKTTTPVAPPVAAAPYVPPKPIPVPPPPRKPTTPAPPSSPIAVYSGTFGVRQAERLLWRAGFGPSPGHAEALSKMGLANAVRSLTRPSGAASLTGPAPKDDNGQPLAPTDAWGHDHLWWLDRMVRTNQPLVERMTLIWHDWFATSDEGVNSQAKMLAQNGLFRRSAFGSFEQLVLDVTQDPAMILWLNQNQNTKWNPNENYARELMELFTLGANRGAYTEDDVRELARSLTGWANDWSAEQGDYNFRFEPGRHDTGVKTVFGSSGNFDWQDGARMCVQHSKHPSYFVEKLWAYFIATPPSAAERSKLEQTYKSSGYQVRPVLEAILMHPGFYSGPKMVKPPVVFIAGMLRALRRGVDSEVWRWVAELAGQRLFRPPDVSGWDESRWLDTSTIRGRWTTVSEGLRDRFLQEDGLRNYNSTETPQQAVAAARAFWNDPPLTSETVSSLTSFAQSCLPVSMADWEQHQYRGLRQNALRHLIASSPDLQVC